MGAGVSATVAALYPDLVSGVILEDPPWRPGSDEGTPEEQAARAAEWRQDILNRKAMPTAALIAQRKREQPKWADEEFTDWIITKQQVSPEVTQYITAARSPGESGASHRLSGAAHHRRCGRGRNRHSGVRCGGGQTDAQGPRRVYRRRGAQHPPRAIWRIHDGGQGVLGRVGVGWDERRTTDDGRPTTDDRRPERRPPRPRP